MIYSFGDFELDVAQAELRQLGQPIKVEPQVFDLLRLLIENAGELQSKNTLIERIWQGRVVSDSAVTSCIKAARQALGDDGRSQRYIKTVHGRGIRFIAPLQSHSPDREPTTTAGDPAGRATWREPHSDAPAAAASRPSIAILPFQMLGDPGAYGAIADALPHELIAELARLRWLFVIARGSSFRFRSEDADVQAVGLALGVHYCVTGSIEIFGDRFAVTVDMADTRDGGVVWAERYAASLESIHEVRGQIVASIISAAEIQISAHESRRARLGLAATDNLDAWTAYHLGVQHMYRFNQADNALASDMFSRAIALDPDFCRAHAGLSFTHFQTAFLHYGDEADAQIALARGHAEQSVDLDALDPFANLTMGRSFWLDGRLDESGSWLKRASELSPNYAQSIYAQAWTDVVSRRGDDGQTHADTAMALSPMDPLLYAMYGTRALSHVVRGERAEAASWAERARVQPNAHVLIDVIAAFAHSMNGDNEAAQRCATLVRKRHPGLTRAEFFRSFPFSSRWQAEIGAEIERLDL